MGKLTVVGGRIGPVTVSLKDRETGHWTITWWWTASRFHPACYRNWPNENLLQFCIGPSFKVKVSDLPRLFQWSNVARKHVPSTAFVFQACYTKIRVILLFVAGGWWWIGGLREIEVQTAAMKNYTFNRKWAVKSVSDNVPRHSIEIRLITGCIRSAIE